MPTGPFAVLALLISELFLCVRQGDCLWRPHFKIEFKLDRRWRHKLRPGELARHIMILFNNSVSQNPSIACADIPKRYLLNLDIEQCYEGTDHAILRRNLTLVCLDHSPIGFPGKGFENFEGL